MNSKGALHFFRSIWRKTDLIMEFYNSHQIEKPAVWQKRAFYLGQCFHKSFLLLGKVREGVVERREGRERRSLHCYVEYEITCQHFLVALNVDVCFQSTEMDIQNRNHPSSAVFGQAYLMAEGEKENQSPMAKL